MSGSIYEQLVELLSRLGDRDVAEKHARRIHAAVRAAARGHDIGHDDTGYYARAQRPKSLGPAKELRDLERLARKAIRGKISQEDWIREWAARPPSVWRGCRPFLMEPGSRTLDRAKLLGFSAPGFTTIVPKPDAVLPAIETALERGKSVAGNKQQRKPDQAALDVIAAVQSAYSALTGYGGARTTLSDARPGRFLRLGHEIDRLFRTRFFPASDSVRLRRNRATKSHSRTSK